MTRVRRPVLRAALLVSLSVVPLGAVELGFRLFSAFPPTTKPTYRQDPAYLYFHAPGSRGWELSPFDEFDPVELVYNAQGFRGAELARAKPSGETRVFVCGDSFVEGRQVAAEKTMSARLEALLAPRRVRVVNAGCSAYTTTTSYLLLAHHLLRFEPDLVVYVFAFNDYFDNHAYGDYAAHPEVFDEGLPASFMPKAYAPLTRGRGVVEWISEHSALGAWLARVAGGGARREARLRVWTEAVEATRFHLSPKLVNARAVDADERRVLAFTHEGIARIAARSKEAGSAFLLAILPMPVQVGAFEWREGKASLGYEPDAVVMERRYQDRLLAFAATKGLAAIDLLPALRAASKSERPVFLAYDGHLSGAGHDAVARALVLPVARLLAAR